MRETEIQFKTEEEFAALKAIKHKHGLVWRGMLLEGAKALENTNLRRALLDLDVNVDESYAQRTSLDGVIADVLGLNHPSTADSSSVSSGEVETETEGGTSTNTNTNTITDGELANESEHQGEAGSDSGQSRQDSGHVPNPFLSDSHIPITPGSNDDPPGYDLAHPDWKVDPKTFTHPYTDTNVDVDVDPHTDADPDMHTDGGKAPRSGSPAYVPERNPEGDQ